MGGGSQNSQHFQPAVPAGRSAWRSEKTHRQKEADANKWELVPCRCEEDTCRAQAASAARPSDMSLRDGHGDERTEKRRLTANSESLPVVRTAML